MIKKFIKRSGLLISALFLFSSTLSAQIDSFDFLKALPSDAQKFLAAYTEPWTNAFGAGLNGSWYNTAKPHKPLGFDLTTSINVGMVPSSASEFDLSSLGLQSLVGTGKTPSISGPESPLPDLAVVSNGRELARFPAPPGTDWRYVPAPIVQLSVGLPLGTEIKGRFVPEIHLQDSYISLWGIGLMHNLTQYLPGDKLLPYDVSLFGGYTKLTGGLPISLEPGTPQNYTTPVNFDDQKLNLTVSGINVSAIGSFNLRVITFYGGLGYSKTKTEIGLSGNFPTPTWNNDLNRVEYNNSGVQTTDDFEVIEIENFSGLRANLGIRLKLAWLTLHADYTRAQYNVFSAGLGISVR